MSILFSLDHLALKSMLLADGEVMTSWLEKVGKRERRWRGEEEIVIEEEVELARVSLEMGGAG